MTCGCSLCKAVREENEALILPRRQAVPTGLEAQQGKEAGTTLTQGSQVDDLVLAALRRGESPFGGSKAGSSLDNPGTAGTSGESVATAHTAPRPAADGPAETIQDKWICGAVDSKGALCSARNGANSAHCHQCGAPKR